MKYTHNAEQSQTRDCILHNPISKTLKKQAKLIHGDKIQNNGFLWGGEGGRDWEGTEGGDLLGTNNNLFLDLSGSYTDVFI